MSFYLIQQLFYNDISSKMAISGSVLFIKQLILGFSACGKQLIQYLPFVVTFTGSRYNKQSIVYTLLCVHLHNGQTIVVKYTLRQSYKIV